MYCIDVFDNGININGHPLTFPLSYDEIKTVLGEANHHVSAWHTIS